MQLCKDCGINDAIVRERNGKEIQYTKCRDCRSYFGSVRSLKPRALVRQANILATYLEQGFLVKVLPPSAGMIV